MAGNNTSHLQCHLKLQFLQSPVKLDLNKCVSKKRFEPQYHNIYQWVLDPVGTSVLIKRLSLLKRHLKTCLKNQLLNP